MTREDMIKVYKRVFETTDGELILKDLMANSHALSGTFSDSPHSMAFKEGRRSLFFDIISNIDIDLKTYRKLNQEVVENDWN